LGPTDPEREGLGFVLGPYGEKGNIYWTKTIYTLCMNTQLDPEYGSDICLRNTAHIYAVQRPKRTNITMNHSESLKSTFPPLFILLSLKKRSKPMLNYVQNKSNLLQPEAERVS
jgi:hypothetical protein